MMATRKGCWEENILHTNMYVIVCTSIKEHLTPISMSQMKWTLCESSLKALSSKRLKSKPFLGNWKEELVCSWVQFPLAKWSIQPGHW